ncbi:hypothetical protein [Bradyrhizobium sp. Gha]|uniref:hypothetical protein n=1 Tax=Bradyrhizobium sp. Gha TaxID=1855318 RepID=UPI0015A623DA|nr:hypothetical protein [Bradyrhizobium sp. Gha]
MRTLSGWAVTAIAAKLKLSEARTALAREQTAALKLKNMVARREYVSLAGVRREVETMFGMLLERLLSLPGPPALACPVGSPRRAARTTDRAVVAAEGGCP